ncbi:MAG TPA: RND transporter [Rhizobiales bacterium]|nr:RND transporter [Hyphomicrobiales bacterium]
MLKWIDQIPLHMLVIVSLTLGLAPFVPEPHIVEKLRMLGQGILSRPIDILDLFMHGTPWLLLILRLLRLKQPKSEAKDQS